MVKMNLNTRFRMCVLCLLFYVTKNVSSNKNALSRKKVEKALHTLREYHGNEEVAVNQTNILLEETKKNLILSFGLRKNMIFHNEDIKRRKPHNYMIYISEMYKNLSKKGIKSLSDSVKECGGLGIPIPSLVSTVRGCADIGGDDGRQADFPHISFKFDISEIPPSETLIESKLKIMMQPPKILQGRKSINFSPRNNFYKVTLYIVLSTEKRSKSHFPTLLEVKSKRLEIIDGQDSRWICFDTSNYLFGIGNKRYIRFILRVQSLGGGATLEPKVLGFSRHDKEDTKKALLVLFTGDQYETEMQNLRKKRGVHMSSQTNKREYRRRKKEKRKKRKKSKKKRYRRKKQCKRKTMMVDFNSFQWTNWLLEPLKYNAYHCHGFCKFPVPRHLTSNNHAIIQALVHSKNKSFVPPPCCVPNEFDPLHILLLDGPDRVVLRRKVGLIARSCACK